MIEGKLPNLNHWVTYITKPTGLKSCEADAKTMAATIGRVHASSSDDIRKMLLKKNSNFFTVRTNVAYQGFGSL